MSRFFRNEKLLFLLILIVASFLRLYRLESTIMFEGDQGRDAIIARQILIDHNLTLIGPVTSVGNMYLGPFYYYFMVPWLALSYPSPVGPHYGVAIVGIITVAFLYVVMKQMFNSRAAVFASLLYATSTVIITSTRFSWNPNIVPIFSLLIVYSLYQIKVNQQYRHIVWASISFALIAQLHYMALLMGPIIIIILLWEFIKSKHKKNIFINAVVGLFAFLLISSPLLIFDLNHNFINAKGFQDFFTSSQQHIRPGGQFIQALQESEGRVYTIISKIAGSPNGAVDRLIVISIALCIAGLLLTKKVSTNQKVSLQIILIWVGVGVIGTSFYSSGIILHYLGFIFPATFMLTGLVLSRLWDMHTLGKGAALLILSWFILINIPTNQAFQPGQSPLPQLQTISQSITDRVGPNEPFDVVLISATRDIDANKYVYFIETLGRNPLPKERIGEANTLFIIDEEKSGENVVDSPIYEIVIFPDKKPVEVYSINDGPIITVLRRQP